MLLRSEFWSAILFFESLSAISTITTNNQLFYIYFYYYYLKSFILLYIIITLISHCDKSEAPK